MIVAESELYRSCRILFGFDLDLSHDFLEYLQLSGIKSAYRNKARETHPDMAATRGELAQARNAVRFTHVQTAYENLLKYLDARENGFRLTASNQRTARKSSQGKKQARQTPPHTMRRTARPTNPFNSQSFNKKNDSAHQTHFNNSCSTADTFYKGVIPQRKLLLGHYLYYSGVINFRNIIQALVWQKTMRPRVGELCLKFGWLTNDDIHLILKHRTFDRPFGRSALNLGLLNVKQVKTILFMQKTLQKKLGEFFIENNILTEQSLEKLLTHHRRHNSLLAATSRFGI